MLNSAPRACVGSGIRGRVQYCSYTVLNMNSDREDAAGHRKEERLRRRRERERRARATETAEEREVRLARRRQRYRERIKYTYCHYITLIHFHLLHTHIFITTTVNSPLAPNRALHAPSIYTRTDLSNGWSQKLSRPSALALRRVRVTPGGMHIVHIGLYVYT